MAYHQGWIGGSFALSRARVALIRIALALSLTIAAAAAGYWVSAQLGRDLLRDEAESQLERLLKGDVSIQELRISEFGLRLEGENVRVYPKLGGHGLVASHVVAKIDPLSLLVGRFHLRSLLILDAHFAIERDATGAWGPYPIASLARDDENPDPEPQLTLIRAFEETTRFLLEEGKIADLLILRGGLVTFLDRDSPAGNDPVEFSLSEIRGTLDHRWLSDAPELEIDSVFVGPGQRRAKVEAEGTQDDDALRISVAATDLAMDTFQPYARALGAEAELGATLSGTFSFETSEKDSSISQIDWVARDLVCAFPRRGAQVRFESPDAHVEARLEVLPERVRLATARIQGREIAMDASAHIERPLTETSEARLALSVRGTRLPELRRFLNALPESDRAPLLKLVEPVESARIVEVRSSGTTQVATWRRVFGGEVANLPPGFSVGAAVDDLTVAVGDGSDRATGISGHIDWSGDRIEIRDLIGRWNSEPIPEIDAVVDGFTFLLEQDGELDVPAPKLPGLAALGDVLRGLAEDPDSPSDAGPMLPPVALKISYLRHPLLRWALHDAQMSLQTSERSSALTIQEGWWNGAPIRGEIVWLRNPERRLNVGLEVRRPGDPTVRRRSPPREPPGDEGSSWFKGRVQVGAAPEGPLGFRELSGELSAAASTLHLSQVAIELDSGGRIQGDLALNLDSAGSVGTRSTFKLVDGDVSRLSGLFGAPRDLATGTVNLHGTLEGPVAPEQSLLAELVGDVSLHAEEGELRQRIPMVVAVATATEGFNPFSARESVRYETVDASFQLDRGAVRCEGFELEGPMRVFASGDLELGEESTIDAVVGVFLFRQADRMLGRLPLVKNLISDKGLVGAYFGVRGPFDDPEVRTLPGKTLAESMPNVVKAPFKVLEFLLSPRDPEEPREPDKNGKKDRQKVRAGPGRQR